MVRRDDTFSVEEHHVAIAAPLGAEVRQAGLSGRALQRAVRLRVSLAALPLGDLRVSRVHQPAIVDHVHTGAHPLDIHDVVGPEDRRHAGRAIAQPLYREALHRKDLQLLKTPFPTGRRPSSHLHPRTPTSYIS